jgi:SagB-type dehydrogenase family enzyme
MAEQDFFVAANVVAIFSAVFERTLKKYGPRGYRYILFEAGHAAQNLCLVAAELGLGSLPLGGFLDSRLNAFLGLDGLAEAALYGVAVGYPLE